MAWKFISTINHLEEISQLSLQTPQLIFKHSTRCASSTMIKMHIERSGFPPNIGFWFLDIIRFRSLSNQLAQDYHVHHESPQVLLIQKGECTFDESHTAISMNEIMAQVNESA